MRIPSYISPSSLALWEKNKEQFYKQRLSDEPIERPLQTDYMSVGSAFDAYIKSSLYEKCLGNNPEFEFDTIFTNQVEEQNRDFALEAGKFAFESYKITGFYDELLEDLLASQFAPQFEFTISGKIEGIPLLGKPDLRYVHKNGTHMILDWKVNGFCSSYGASPYKYYQLIKDGWIGKQSASHNTSHKFYGSLIHKGIEISNKYLEDTCKDWADQLAIYSWLLNEPIGSEDAIICIDQLACKSRKNSKFPEIRVAKHRCRISRKWQFSLLERLKSCWESIKSGYIFNELTLDESNERCDVLDMPTNSEDWLAELSNQQLQFRKRNDTI
jgi:hypothetical protein